VKVLGLERVKPMRGLAAQDSQVIRVRRGCSPRGLGPASALGTLRATRVEQRVSSLRPRVGLPVRCTAARCAISLQVLQPVLHHHGQRPVADGSTSRPRGASRRDTRGVRIDGERK